MQNIFKNFGFENQVRCLKVRSFEWNLRLRWSCLFCFFTIS